MKIVSVVADLPTFDSLGMAEVLQYVGLSCNPIYQKHPTEAETKIRANLQVAFGTHLDIEFLDVNGAPCADRSTERQVVLRVYTVPGRLH